MSIRRAGTIVRHLLTVAGLLVFAFGPAPVASASAPSASGPYQAVHVFERHAGELRLLPASAAARLPRSHLPEHLRISHATKTASSTNWAGYGEIMCGSCADRYIQADFTIPSANCAKSPDGAVYGDWAGLDGFTTSTVEQTGIDAICQGGTPVYFAWYEMFPAPTVMYVLASAPGDNILVSVYFNGSTGKYSLNLDDTTLGAGFSTTATCPSVCQNKSAEVITEAFSECTSPSSCTREPLAAFGQANFNGARWTSRNGTHFSLESGSLATGYAITMLNTAMTAVDALPGPLTDGAIGGIPVSDFSVFWQGSN